LTCDAGAITCEVIALGAAPEQYRGRYNGLLVLTWSIGMLLGPALGMLLFQGTRRFTGLAWPAREIEGASLALVGR
jgi:MFS family permease